MSKQKVMGSILVAAMAVGAQTQAAETETLVSTAPGRATIAETVEVTASVLAVDQGKRLVTLKGPDGETFVVQAGPEVKNFAQINVGDQVAARYVEALTLQLKKGGGAMREQVISDEAAAARPGDRPGAAVGRTITTVADVTAVDPKRQTVRLRGPERTVDLKVPDPNQFALVKVGDQVEVTFIEAMALSVEPMAKK